MLGAAIDLGSNTVRLLIGETNGSVLVPLQYFRRITRLAGGGNLSTGLADDAIGRTLAAIREMSTVLKEFPIERVRMVGTEAVRRAKNADRLQQGITAACGIHLEIISGEEEARLCAAGARIALDPLPENYLLFDIGGGSTEFTLQCDATICYHRSFPLGVVTLAEQTTQADLRLSLIRQTIAELREDIDKRGLTPLVRDARCLLVGTAGTVTTLAALQLQMSSYDWRRVNNLVLHRDFLHDMQKTLGRLSCPERLTLPGMEPGREDLIVPGLEIVMEILQTFRKSSLKVSDFGLLEGVLLSLGQHA